jgi:hypothetical protein
MKVGEKWRLRREHEKALLYHAKVANVTPGFNRVIITNIEGETVHIADVEDGAPFIGMPWKRSSFVKIYKKEWS